MLLGTCKAGFLNSKFSHPTPTPPLLLGIAHITLNACALQEPILGAGFDLSIDQGHLSPTLQI